MFSDAAIRRRYRILAFVACSSAALFTSCGSEVTVHRYDNSPPPVVYAPPPGPAYAPAPSYAPAPAYDNYQPVSPDVLNLSAEVIAREGDQAPPTEYPGDVNVFVDELQPYGGWVEVPNYGHCWRPRGIA